MPIRGVRGAITAEENTADNILSNTEHLLKKIIDKNAIEKDDIASIFFSITDDLTTTFPAQAARNMGLTETPLLCLNEIKVPEGLQQCIRILMHVNTDVPQSEIHHIYLKEASQLRPDQVK